MRSHIFNFTKVLEMQKCNIGSAQGITVFDTSNCYESNVFKNSLQYLHNMKLRTPNSFILLIFVQFLVAPVYKISPTLCQIFKQVEEKTEKLVFQISV